MPAVKDIRSRLGEPGWLDKMLRPNFDVTHDRTIERRQIDIFFFSRLLESKLPGFLQRVEEKDVATVDLAIPDILADAEKLTSEILPSLDGLPNGDVEELGDALTDMREVLLHTQEQVGAAERALGNLIDVCGDKK